MTSLSQRVARITPRERRALSLGALVLLPAIGFQLVVRPYTSRVAGVRARVEREQDLLRREQGLLAEVKAYPTRLRQSETALLHEAPRLFAGPDLVAASAALSNYVTGHALRSHVFVQQSETGSPGSTSEGIGRLQVELRAVGDLEGILAFLQRLESGPKLVTVERLAIGQTERLGGVTRDDEVLSLTATIGGYALDDPEAEVRP
jgi:hypothetical protein